MSLTPKELLALDYAAGASRKHPGQTARIMVHPTKHEQAVAYLKRTYPGMHVDSSAQGVEVHTPVNSQ